MRFERFTLDIHDPEALDEALEILHEYMDHAVSRKLTEEAMERELAPGLEKIYSAHSKK